MELSTAYLNGGILWTLKGKSDLLLLISDVKELTSFSTDGLIKSKPFMSRDLTEIEEPEYLVNNIWSGNELKQR